LYPRSKECGIDDYTLVEDSFNVPILVHEAKQCVDYWQYGKSIYPSLELCADAVKANTTNCASGLGYFFYSATEKLCRCCTKSDSLTNIVDSTTGSNLYKLSTNHGVHGKFAYNYT
jgi:hypothetical protein